MEIDKLQNILKNKSTTFVRKILDKYCIDNGFIKWNYKKEPCKWYLSQYDCKRRLRTICRFYDGEHELNISLRKKAGYYFIIEYDRKRIFECVPEVIVLDAEMLDMVVERYKDLFDLLTV